MVVEAFCNDNKILGVYRTTIAAESFMIIFCSERMESEESLHFKEAKRSTGRENVAYQKSAEQEVDRKRIGPRE
jgi:hypothetical protein